MKGLSHKYTCIHFPPNISYILFLYLRNSAFPSRFNSNTASSLLGRIPLMQHLLISIVTLVILFHQSLFPRKSLKPETMSCFVYFFLNFYYLFTYLWLCWVFTLTHMLSLVVKSGGYSLVVVQGLLTAVASLDAQHGLKVCRLQ